MGSRFSFLKKTFIYAFVKFMKLRSPYSIWALDPNLHQRIWLHLSALLDINIRSICLIAGEIRTPKGNPQRTWEEHANWSQGFAGKDMTACCAEGHFLSFFSPKGRMVTISNSNRLVDTHDNRQVRIMYICSFNPDLSGSLSIHSVSPYTMWLTLAQKSWPTLPAGYGYTTWKHMVMNTIWVAERHIKHPHALWP